MAGLGGGGMAGLGRHGRIAPTLEPPVASGLNDLCPIFRRHASRYYNVFFIIIRLLLLCKLSTADLSLSSTRLKVSSTVLDLGVHIDS